MGICFSKKSSTSRKIHSKRVTNQSTASFSRNVSVNRWSRVRSSSVKTEKSSSDDVIIHEQAIAAAALLFQQQNLRFERSNSQCQQIVRRSCSNRRRSVIDPVNILTHQIVDQVCLLSVFG